MKKTMIIWFGVSLLVVGALIFAYGSLTHYSPHVNENGGFVDYIAIFSFVFGGIGALILALSLFSLFKKWGRESGAIVHG